MNGGALLMKRVNSNFGRNTTYKLNFFWFKDQIVNSNFGEDQIIVNKGKTRDSQFPLPPKSAGVSNDENGIQ